MLSVPDRTPFTGAAGVFASVDISSVCFCLCTRRLLAGRQGLRQHLRLAGRSGSSSSPATPQNTRPGRHAKRSNWLRSSSNWRPGRKASLTPPVRASELGQHSASYCPDGFALAQSSSCSIPCAQLACVHICFQLPVYVWMSSCCSDSLLVLQTLTVRTRMLSLWSTLRTMGGAGILLPKKHHQMETRTLPLPPPHKRRLTQQHLPHQQGDAS